MLKNDSSVEGFTGRAHTYIHAQTRQRHDLIEIVHITAWLTSQSMTVPRLRSQKPVCESYSWKTLAHEVESEAWQSPGSALERLEHANHQHEVDENDGGGLLRLIRPDSLAL
jgi:hypothetical protein